MCVYTSQSESWKARTRSEEIDRQIEVDSSTSRKHINVLLFGIEGSGKTTIMHQMRMQRGQEFSQDELLVARNIMYKSLVETAQSIVLAMRRIGIEPLLPKTILCADRILEYKLDPNPSFILEQDIVLAIHQLSQDPVARNVANGTIEGHLMEHATYYLDEALRIGKSDFMPTPTDVLWTWQQAKAVVETKCNMGVQSVNMIRVGGQHMQNARKWMHCFESVTSVIFCVSLSDYDQVEYGKNLLIESIAVFRSMVNSPWFSRTSIILLFTKMDVFKQKIKQVPLDRYFPDCTGGGDISKATEYILLRFMETNRTKLVVYPHFTHSTDDQLEKHVFAAIKETMLIHAFKDARDMIHSSRFFRALRQ